MCALAHYFEAAGLSTLVIGLIPQHVERMRPPRALSVPFQMGRPLGVPDDPGFQRSVLAAVFGLLDRPGPGPLLEVYPGDAPEDAQSDQTWACPVSFPDAQTPPASRVHAEVRALAPWFARACERRGRTATGASGLPIEQACDLLVALRGGRDIGPPAHGTIEFGDLFKLAAEDLKMYYAEAAMEQPDPGSVQQVQDWFWNDTAAGRLLFELAESCADHPDKLVRIHARFTLVPVERLATGH